MKRSFLAILVVLCLFLYTETAVTFAEPDGNLIKQASLNWLELIDSGKYEESWTTASEPFQQSTSKQKWIEAIKNFRASTGTLNRRDLMRLQYVNEIPGGTKGLYCIVTFTAQFENKSFGYENVILTAEDELWKVITYYIGN